MLRHPLSHPLRSPHQLPTRRRRGGGGWTPATLFSGGEQGGWYDPSDMASLFQDSAGTTPVTASGDPIGKWLDKSGRGNHLTQAAAASRFLLNISGGLSSAVIDGLDDFMSVALNLSGGPAATVIAGWRQDASVGQELCSLTASPTTTPGAFRLGQTVSSSIYAGLRGDTADNAHVYHNAGSVPATRVVTQLMDLSQAAASDEKIVRVNGVVQTASSVIAGGPAGGGNFANSTLYVGRRGGTSLTLNGRFYQLIIIGRILTAGEIALAETYVGGKTGIPL